MDNPRAGTFCLLLAVGLGIWSVFNSLDQGNRRLVLHDPSNGVQSSVKPPAPPSVIEIRWLSGKTTRTSLPAGLTEITLTSAGKILEQKTK